MDKVYRLIDWWLDWQLPWLNLLIVRILPKFIDAQLFFVDRIPPRIGLEWGCGTYVSQFWDPHAFTGCDWLKLVLVFKSFIDVNGAYGNPAGYANVEGIALWPFNQNSHENKTYYISFNRFHGPGGIGPT